MTALTPYQLDILTRTVLGEAGDASTRAQMDVAHIVQNRALSGKFPTDPAKVALQPSQFSAWNKGVGGNNPSKWNAGSAAYQKAQQSVLSVFNGSDPDPFSGGTAYHATSVTPYWAKSANTNGTITRNGHVFYKGNGSSALSAINTVAPPIPRARPTPDASAYANSSVPTPPAMPPPATSIRSVEINPNGTPKAPPLLSSLLPPSAMYGVQGNGIGAGGGLSGRPGLMAPPIPTNYGPDVTDIPNAGYWDGNDTFAGTGVGSVQDPRLAALQHGAPSIQLPIGMGRPASAIAPNSFPAAAVPPPLPLPRPSNITAEGLTIRPVTSVAIDPITGDPVGSNVSRESPNLQAAVNALAASKAASLGGSTKTTSNPAGSVPMPPGAVPKAAQTMLSQIAASQLNKSGSPDERSTYIPPSIPKPLSAGPTPTQLAYINDVSHVPVPGGVINPSGVKVAAGNVTGKNTDQLSPTLAYGPPGYVPPSVAAISAATVPLPRPRPTPAVPTIPARPPAAYQLANIPNNGVNPFSQAGPQVASHVAQSGLGHIIQYLTGEPVQGGLLGMLPRLPAFGSSAPAQSAANPPIPYPTVGTSFLQSQGQNTAGMTSAQISNALRDALASSSRQSGSGPGSQ